MLLSDAFFASTEIHEKTVELPDGTKHLVHFKEAPATDVIRFSLAQRSGDEQRQVECMQRLIAASLCDADGKLALTIEEALRLNIKATNALFAKAMEVNGSGEPGNE